VENFVGVSSKMETVLVFEMIPEITPEDIFPQEIAPQEKIPER